MAKLTPTQIFILRVLNDDVPESELDGFTMPKRSGLALERRGLIREAQKDPNDPMQHFMAAIGAVKMELTDAGRRALADAEEGRG